MPVMDRLKLLKQGPTFFLKFSEQPLCRPHANNLFLSLDVFLVFDREYLMCSLSEPATTRKSEEQLL